jgi:iron(III) transport system substrate-binding protein
MHDHVRPRWVAGGIATVLAVASMGLAACGGSDTSSSSSTTASSLSGTEATMYDAAKKDGSLTWYSSAPPAQMDATIAAFKKRYPGIDVRVARLASGPLETRYAQERESGAGTADVVTNAADPKFDATAAEKKWMETSVDLPAMADFPKKWVKNGQATVGLLQLVIGYTTPNLTGAAVPKSWQDILDPRF